MPLELEAGFSQNVERAIEVGMNLVPQRRCTGRDKTVYEREKASLAQAFNTLMLADKAYAGVFDEGAALLRPIKRGERLWREQPEMAQAFNRALSLKRVRVEHLFARLKTFKVLQGLFPYSTVLLGPVMRLLALAHNLNREGAALLPTG